MTHNNSRIGGGGLHHVALRVADFDASMKFYCDVLGFTEKVRWGEAPKRAVMIDSGDGNYLELFEGAKKPPNSDDAYFHVALRSDDVDAAMRHIAASGAVVTMEPKTVENLGGRGFDVRIAFFKGPDGELIELYNCKDL